MLNEQRDILAKHLFGETITDSKTARKCVCCKQPIHFTDEPDGREGNIYSEAGRQEYSISGLCEYCFDESTKEPEDE